MTEWTIFHAGLVLKVKMYGWPSEFMQKFDGVKCCAHWCVFKQRDTWNQSLGIILHKGKCCLHFHPIGGVTWLTFVISKTIFCLLIRAPFWKREIQTETESWSCYVYIHIHLQQFISKIQLISLVSHQHKWSNSLAPSPQFHKLPNCAATKMRLLQSRLCPDPVVLAQTSTHWL